MTAEDISRLVVPSAIPAGPSEQKTLPERAVVHPLLQLFFGGGYDDMRRMEDILAKCDRDWTVPRPPRLTAGPSKHQYRTGIDSRLSRASRIPRRDLAAAMLAALDQPNWIGHAVNLAT
jgi:hypothetical protein